MYGLTQLIAIGTGLLVAQVLGMWCKCFLCQSVAATVRKSIRLDPRRENGGSRQLGTLEVLLFFTSISLREYTIAAAWLGFKVAAQWAAWQHIAQMPRETSRSNNPSMDASNVYVGLRERLRFSNNLLGRFLNGTLYNIVAAGTGGIIANVISTSLTHRLFFLSELFLWGWLISLWVVNIFLIFSILIWGRPRFCEHCGNHRERINDRQDARSAERSTGQKE